MQWTRGVLDVFDEWRKAMECPEGQRLVDWQAELDFAYESLLRTNLSPQQASSPEEALQTWLMEWMADLVAESEAAESDDDRDWTSAIASVSALMTAGLACVVDEEEQGGISADDSGPNRAGGPPRLRVVGNDDAEAQQAEPVEWPDGITLRIPDGYMVAEDGVYRYIRKPTGQWAYVPVCLAPVCITHRTIDQGSGCESWTLAWKERGRWRTLQCDRAIAQQGRAICTLASRGFPVSSASAGHVVAYLEGLCALNIAVIPVRELTSRCGWVRDSEGRRVFVAGETVIPPRGAKTEMVPSDSDYEGLGRIMRAMVPRGTERGWKQSLAIAERYDPLLCVLAASLAAPVLELLELPGFVLSLDGRTSSGKTTALRLAASVWGSPDDDGRGLITTWDSTRFAIEHLSGALGNLPLLIDDTRRWVDKRTRPGDVVYQLTQGQGRGRGASADAMRQTRRWRFVTVSTGEDPLTSDTEAGGLRARVLQLWGSPFGGSQPQDVRELTRICRRHYGLAGRQWARQLQYDAAKRTRWLTERLDELETAYPIDGDVEGRLGANARVLGAVMWGACEWMGWWGGSEAGPRMAERVIRCLYATIEGERDQADPATRAWMEVHGWLAAQVARVYDPSRFHDREPAMGWIANRVVIDGEVEWQIEPGAFREWCARNGHRYDSILRSWADSKRLVRYELSHLATKRKLGTSLSKVRLLCVRE